MSATEIRTDGLPVPAARAGGRGGLRGMARRLEGRVDPTLRTLFWIACVPGVALLLLAGLAAHAPLHPMHGLGALAADLPPLPPIAGIAPGPLLHGAALLFVLGLVHRLTRLDALPAMAERATWLALLAPTTALLWRHPALAATTLLTLLTLYLARRTRWWAAGTSGALLALWHPGGALLALPLLVHYLAVRGVAPRRWEGSIAATLLPAGAALALAATEALRGAAPSWGSALAQSFAGTANPQLPWQSAQAWYAAAAQGGLAAPAAAPLLALLGALLFTLIGLRRLRGATIALVLAVALLALLHGDPLFALGLTPLLLPLLAVPAQLLEGRAGLERATWCLLLIGLLLLLGVAGPLHAP